MAKVDNPKAFKHLIDRNLLMRIDLAIKSVYVDFDSSDFLKVDKTLKNLELKDRVRVVRESLKNNLPKDFPSAVKILIESLKAQNLKGFDLWPYTEFIESYGLNHFEVSMTALYELTQRFTAEFAIRPFLIHNSESTYKRLLKWAHDPNVHVRRWTSEGTRPRLPWGLRLHSAIQDPTHGLDILEILKRDPELYVRKSIANHLNDISKDHPDLVLKTLQKWKTEWPPAEIENYLWIQRHSLRTLIKKGYQPALKIMGVRQKLEITCQNFKLNKKSFKVNDLIQMQFDLQSTSKHKQKVIVDYVIHFVTARGTKSTKVFKLKTCLFEPGEQKTITKIHSLKPITTRRYYAGVHQIDVQINGRIVKSLEWNLKN